MDMEAKVAEAITFELQRQAESSQGRLKVSRGGGSALEVQGPVDLEALAMAIVGSVAGGP